MTLYRFEIVYSPKAKWDCTQLQKGIKVRIWLSVNMVVGLLLSEFCTYQDADAPKNMRVCIFTSLIPYLKIFLYNSS